MNSCQHDNTVVAFTAACEEDACWVDQYLAEAERLRLPFAVHLDRCPPSIPLVRLTTHPLCVGTTKQDDQAVEFEERHKQGVLDLVAGTGCRWALAWDVDETYERDARARLNAAANNTADCLDARWLNLWGDRDHVRVDGHWCAGHRVKLLNLQDGRRWRFDHPIINGPKLVGREGVTGQCDIVCLHHGMMLPELRRQHRDRWDRIYSTALRGDPNPYGFWRDAIKTEAKAIMVRHGY